MMVAVGAAYSAGARAAEAVLEATAAVPRRQPYVLCS